MEEIVVLVVEIVEDTVVVKMLEIVGSAVDIEEKLSVEEVTVTELALEEVTETELGQEEIVVESAKIGTDRVDTPQFLKMMEWTKSTVLLQTVKLTQ